MVSRRLNFGCGAQVIDGWTNCDAVYFEGADIIGDALPYADGAFDLAVANHALCAIPHLDVPHWLEELARVLAPGGVLRILVPDLLGAFRAYERRDLTWFPTLHTPTVDAAFTAYLTWWSENRSVFTAPSLVALVQDAGLIASTGPPRHTICEDPTILALDSRLEESIIVEGIKRA